LNTASLLILALLPASLFAIAAPLLRARRHGCPLKELVVPAIILLLLHTYVYSGARAWWIAAMVGITGTEFGIRAIRLRLSAKSGGLVEMRHLLLLLPAGPAVFLDSHAAAGICATIAAVATIGSFGTELLASIRVTRALDMSSDTCSPAAVDASPG
jgi:hypothetical protein